MTEHSRRAPRPPDTPTAPETPTGDDLYHPEHHYTRDHDAREPGAPDTPRVKGADADRPPHEPPPAEGDDGDPPA